MNTTAMEYRSAHEALASVLDRVSPEGWERPSPCAGWAARDVVRHLIDTQRDLFAERGVDLGRAPAAEADPAAAWRDHAQRVAAAIADDAVPAIAYEGYFGPTTLGETLERFYVWDMLVHRWDVARAAGANAGFTETELDRIEQGAVGFGKALYMEGICVPGVQPPPDADRTVRLLARLGRVA